MTALRRLGTYVAILCCSLVAALTAVAIANWAAQGWLRANPRFLMSAADRVNENTRVVREGMITGDRAVEWYDLGHADEVRAMWAEFYRAGAEFESYTHFRPRAFRGRYYGVTSAGYRLARVEGPWPPTPANYNVFFFGGSTAFGVGPYWATVASYLQEAMDGSGRFDRPVRVYNFGRSGYQSSQEQVLFHRLLSVGHRPDMVVFLDGLNDFCWIDGNPSSWQALAQFFNGTNEAYRRTMEGHGIVTQWGSLRQFVETMPLMRLIGAAIDRTTAEAAPRYTAGADAPPETPEPPAVLRGVIDRYLGNMRQVKAVAEAFGIEPVFVWQPIPTYKYDLRYHAFNPDRLGCHVNSKFGYPIMAQVAAAKPLGDRFVWAADMQEGLKEPLYVDAFHYTAPMSRRIAAFIDQAIRARQRPAP